MAGLCGHAKISKTKFPGALPPHFCFAFMKISTLALLCASSLFSANALAQWQWRDDQGRQVFSDRPPPIQVPAERIIRSPAAKAPSTARAVPAATAQARSHEADEQAKKSATEAAEAQREQAQAEEQKKKQAQQRQDNCTRAQAALTTLADGRLLAHTNSQGERAFMDDSTRAAERQRAQSVIDADCGPVSALRPQ